jgi:thymidylate synthase
MDEFFSKLHTTTAGTVLISEPSVGRTVRRLSQLLEHGVGEVCSELTRRGGKVREVRGLAVLEVRAPYRRLSVLAGRQGNPWVSLCEFPWIIAGRSDVAWVGNYLPRAADFSDDGLTWRAGYGPRMRAWPVEGYSGLDQLSAVVERLEEDPFSRQAVISLWDPDTDNQNGSRDYPCSNWLHFQVKDGALDLTVTMRSNDLIWGYSGVNAVNFTLIQELVATLLGVQLGVYRHVCDNMHVYERHFPRLGRMAASPDLYDKVASPRVFRPFWNLDGKGAEGLQQFTRLARRALSVVEQLRHEPEWFPSMAKVAEMLEAEDSDTFLVEWAYFMSLWPHAKADNGWTDDQWIAALLPLEHTDWAVAALVWLAETRKRPSLAGAMSRWSTGLRGDFMHAILEGV